MQMPGRKYQPGSSSYRYGFNGKENDSEVKGEGNQQDYGFRIYDPRLGRFLSVDPLIANYPELASYQFASNRPIAAIDLDGLEAKDLARELEPVRAQRKKEAMYGIVYPETKSQRYLRYFVTGGLGATAIGGITAVVASAIAATTQAAVTGLIVWATNPANQGVVLLLAEGALELVNPDPGYNIDLSPGPGSEVVKSFKLLFKTKAGKLVEATLENGSKFDNLAEVNWFEKLLSEGNDVHLLKEINKGNGEKSADFLVNGIKTEIKEIANITSPRLGNNIKTTMQDAISQVGDGGSIVIDVSRQVGATKELMLNTIERLKGNAKQTTNYRVVGKGFELTGSITQKKE